MRTGTIRGIFITPRRRAPMETLEQVEAIAGRGLAGDRYASGHGSYNQGTVGKRQVTLINGRFIKGSGFEPHETRRNLVVTGVELMYLIGREFQVGEAKFRGVKYCDPCKVPRAAADPSLVFETVFEDVGGLIAEVIAGGWVHLGDTVVPPQKPY